MIVVGYDLMFFPPLVAYKYSKRKTKGAIRRKREKRI